MGIVIQWDDEETRSLLLVRFEQNWNWGEFRQAILQVVDETTGLEHPVDIILNFLDSTPFQEFDGLTHVWWLLRQCESSEGGYFVLVTHDMALRVVVNVIRQSSPALRPRLLVAGSEQAARSLINTRRA